MAKYYSVLVAVEVEDAKGKVKKNKENYLKNTNYEEYKFYH